MKRRRREGGTKVKGGGGGLIKKATRVRPACKESRGARTGTSRSMRRGPRNPLPVASPPPPRAS